MRHPARIVPLAFLGHIAIGAVLLSLPIARRGPGGAPFMTAVFTAFSNGCVTGLTVVDTATYWTTFGHLVLLGLMQVGGFGIMAMATLLALTVSRRIGLGRRIVTQAETHSVALGDVRGVLFRVAAFTFAVELIVAIVLTLRFFLAYDYSLGKAAWFGIFHSVSAFNNDGVTLYSDGLVRFVNDSWVSLSVTIAIIAGSLGFPVIYELTRRKWHTRRRWSTHTRITIYGTLVLLAVGFLSMLALEWSNPNTFGPLDVPGKLLAAFFQGTTPRTAGLSTVDFGQMHPETLLITDWLMFIGGGSAGTSGGIKVTTFVLLAYVIWAEMRSERDVVAGGRRIAESTQRQALTVALLGVLLVALGTFALLMLTDEPLQKVFFEAMSAFSTTGLSLGITPTLGTAGQLVIIALMYIGRVGTITFASALALSERRALYRYAEERPIVG